MSEKTMYHINCDCCGAAFWSEKPNNLGDELCNLCERIKELESAMQEFVELYENYDNTSDTVEPSIEKFKELLK